MTLGMMLAAAREKPIAVVHRFLLQHNPSADAIHAFFEGRTDESFYGPNIRRLKKDEVNYYSYVCGNKRNVYGSYNLLRQKGINLDPIMFLVDRDIDWFLGVRYEISEHIYITDYYSVESHLVDERLLLQVWAEIIRQGSGGAITEFIQNSYRIALSEYTNLAIDLMAWFIYHVRKGNKPNLNNAKLGRLYNITDSLVINWHETLDDTILKMDEWCDVETDLDNWHTEHPSINTQMTQHDSLLLIRGKWLLDFFVSFLRALTNIARREPGVTVPLEISEANALDILGPRVKIPCSLSDYLKRKLQVQEQLQFS